MQEQTVIKQEETTALYHTGICTVKLNVKTLAHGLKDYLKTGFINSLSVLPLEHYKWIIIISQPQLNTHFSTLNLCIGEVI